MKYFSAVMVVLSALLYAPFVHAQEHGHEHDGHKHLRNEIGISGGAFYSYEHREWGSGIHMHYFRTMGLHSNWSLGASLEQAWVDGNHVNVGIGIKYQLFTRLNIATFPGVTFFSHGDEGHDHSSLPAKFTLHFELVYDLFHWDNFHFGPVIDYSWSKNHSHSMIGIHAAFCF